MGLQTERKGGKFAGRAKCIDVRHPGDERESSRSNFGGSTADTILYIILYSYIWKKIKINPFCDSFAMRRYHVILNIGTRHYIVIVSIILYKRVFVVV